MASEVSGTQTTESVEVGDAELLQAIGYVIRQNRELFMQRGKAPHWSADHRPEELAKKVLEHIRLCGIQTTRTTARRGHSTPG